MTEGTSGARNWDACLPMPAGRQNSFRRASDSCLAGCKGTLSNPDMAKHQSWDGVLTSGRCLSCLFLWLDNSGTVHIVMRCSCNLRRERCSRCNQYSAVASHDRSYTAAYQYTANAADAGIGTESMGHVCKPASLMASSGKQVALYRGEEYFALSVLILRPNNMLCTAGLA